MLYQNLAKTQASHHNLKTITSRRRRRRKYRETQTYTHIYYANDHDNDDIHEESNGMAF